MLLFPEFCNSVLIVASCFMFALWIPSSPEFKELMVTRPSSFETVIIPHCSHIKLIPAKSIPVYHTDFIPTLINVNTEVLASEAIPVRTVSYPAITATVSPSATKLAGSESKQAIFGPRARPVSSPKLRSVVPTSMAMLYLSLDPHGPRETNDDHLQPTKTIPSSLLRSAKDAVISEHVLSEDNLLSISEHENTKSSAHTGGVLRRFGASQAMNENTSSANARGQKRSTETHISPHSYYFAKKSISSGFLTLFCIVCHIWAAVPHHKRRSSAYMFISAVIAAIISLEVTIRYMFVNRKVGFTKLNLQQKLVNVLARARCVSSQCLISGARTQGLLFYRKILIMLLTVSPMCKCFPSIHGPSMEKEEKDFSSLQHVEARPSVESTVPKLKSTSLTVSQPAFPRDKVARLRLVSVSGPCRVDKAKPLSQKARAEKDGVDQKDTFAFAFENTDPWACQLISTLLQIQELALSSPLSTPYNEKTGGTSCRDDDEVVLPLRVNKRQECMPAFNSQNEVSSKNSMEFLDLGTRVANCQALGRFNSDSISNIFEGSNQARCAVFSLTAEVGRTESLRRYRKEIEYIENAAKQEPQPTQSSSSISFDLSYKDENYELIVEATKFQKQAMQVLDKLRDLNVKYQSQLSENAPSITTPEPEKITELVNMYFESQNPSVAKQLQVIEKALLRRTQIDQACLDEVHGLFDILRVVVKDYTNASYDYIDADDENRWDECQPDYYSWLLTQRVRVYRLLPTE